MSFQVPRKPKKLSARLQHQISTAPLAAAMRQKVETAVLLCTLALLLPVSPVLAESFMEALERGDKAVRRGDDQEAISAYIFAKSLAGTNGLSEARRRLAKLYHQLKRFDEAESEYQSMISMSNSIDIKIDLAQLYMDSGKFRNAMIMYQQLLADYPKEYKYAYALGTCHEATDSMESAKDYYRKVIEMAPASAEAEAALGRMARLDTAIKAVQSAQFFPIDPDMGQVGMGWWNLKKMPIHVYIDQGDSKNYRPAMRSHIIDALEAWRKASGGNFTFVVDPPDPRLEQAFKTAMESKVIGQNLEDIPMLRPGIHVHWGDNYRGFLGMAVTNVVAEMGSTKLERCHEITNVNLFMHTNALAGGQPLPDTATGANASLFEAQDRLMAYTAIHELGHGFGLPHSSNPKDIMCAGIYAFNAQDMVETTGLSTNDIASLRQHYNGFTGTGMPQDIVVRRKDGSPVIYHDGSKVQSGRVSNAAPIRMAAPSLTPSPLAGSGNSASFKEVSFEMDSHNYQAAVDKLTAILQKDAHNSMALYLRGVNKVMLHKYPEAIEDYQTVIKISPGSELAMKAVSGLKKLNR